MSGIEGNKRLLEAGLVEQVSRYSISKGKDVLQWVITKKRREVWEDAPAQRRFIPIT